MKVDGQCHCGQIAYTAEIDPAKVNACHCTDCQVLSGGPYIISTTATPGSFKLLRGEPHIYMKTAESGRKRAHGLCTNCGTRLFAATPEEPRVYGLRIPPLAQRNQLKPSRQIWCRSARPWALLESVERVELAT